ncbi:MAG: bifunctional aspartate kinase/homoserine dehydrogenase I, partial [Thermomicrobiales bacterium]|nr:bifunctional aspartate kinase/homoserine dehydrogenase I [Thermomicrobiales bacterium]
VGAGTVGGAAIEQELALREQWREQLGVDVVIGAVIGGGGAIVADTADGLAPDLLTKLVADRRAGHRLADSETPLTDPLGAIAKLAAFGPVIVMDAGAGDRTTAIDVAALEAGGGVVLSNKAPMAMPAGSIGDRLWAETGPGGRVRYEATVGAGLPVLSTLRTLLGTGDDVLEITGTVSGTFGAIFSDLASGNLFSKAVRTAKANGYTEPDPRDDLSGLDVARKALILARTLGRSLDLTDIAIESLVPESLASVSIEEFLNQISLLDDSIAERASAAAANGEVLKYVLAVKPDGAISVGVAPISTSTVLGALQGPENIVSFRTDRYDKYPLVVSGPGAGAAVTAAGMTGDMLSLADAVR